MFGLDPKQPAPAEAVPNVLAGKRADEGMPQSAAGKTLPREVVEGARKRFKAAPGVPVALRSDRRRNRPAGERPWQMGG